jgi:hypothetical protein
LDYLVAKTVQGWRLSAIEWVREIDSEGAAEEGSKPGTEGEELAYGIRLSESGTSVERNAQEIAVLLLILEEIIKERRVTEIAAVLNRAGHRTRSGALWTPAAVFNLLPRLIEIGPQLLNSPEWTRRRRAAVSAT